MGVGGTHRPSPSGLSQFSSLIKPTWHSGDASGMSRAGIRRDGVEFRYVEAPGIGLSSSLTIPVPPPGGALHWYHLEMENAKGRKFQTLPIWDEDGSRVKTVKVPVWKEDGSFAEFEIEDTRVPYWHYPVDDDVGPILLDVSGWEHHGRLLSGKSDYGGGHLNYTGYNHYHNGYAAPADGRFSKRFKRDPDGRGYLTFNGSNDYVMVMGGTAFPGAFTYELSVRPAALGREMGLLGTANGQVNVTLLADGALRVEKTGARGANGAEANTRFTRACVSSSRIEPGVWTKVAVTYDLRLLRLYVNGTASGEVSVGPMRNHERINHVTIGSKCGVVYEPRDFFNGDIRAVRIALFHMQQSAVLAGDPDRLDAHLLNHRHKRLVDLARKYHLNNINRFLICDPESVNKFRLLSESVHQIVDLGSSAVNKNNLDAYQSEQDNVFHDLLFELLVDHCVSAVFDHNDLVIVLLDVGQRLS